MTFSCLAVTLPNLAQAELFTQINLVSNVSGLAANTDPNLKNPWGMSFSATSPFWVSNQASGTATIYNGAGTPQPLVVAVPGGPTGQVFNGTSDFALGLGSPATFIFATFNGKVLGWNSAQGTTAYIAVDHSASAAYTGLALANNGSANFLYAANHAQGTIDVFNSAYTQTSFTGSFTDPNLPAGFTPYNIQNLGGKLYVTYENGQQGSGIVDAFDANGSLLQRITSNSAGGPLDSPWGLAIAPPGFGEFGGALLVGNHGDGHISAFDPTTGTYLGQLLDGTGNPIANPGLWGLTFGNGGNGGDPNTLYFTAGINGGSNGLFGAIQPVPEPTSAISLGLGALVLLAFRRRSKSA